MIYSLLVLGSPSARDLSGLKDALASMLEPFGLRLGETVALQLNPASYAVSQDVPVSAVHYCQDRTEAAVIKHLLRNAVPIIPVASRSSRVKEEVPASLQPLNCMFTDQHNASQIAAALLECVGLLPKQRRVFLSYRRQDSREIALQLFDELTARKFGVFLDTHSIGPAREFQPELWHELSNSDVLLMLDTPGYFESRWTAQEFGRAMAKQFAILRVAWPGVSGSNRTSTCWVHELRESDLQDDRLIDDAVGRICTQLEVVRSQSVALRQLAMVSKLRRAMQEIKGSVTGSGMQNRLLVTLPDGREVAASTVLGVPTSLSMEEASHRCEDDCSAVIYDHFGVHERWLEHMAWLARNVKCVRWVKATEAAYEFAGWE